MNKKIVINNSFFDILAFLFSFVISFFRSFKLFLGFNIKKKNIYFNFLDFVLRGWSKYFWDKPSFYKITSFFGDMLNSVFKNK